MNIINKLFKTSFELGQMYYLGDGVPKDYAKAFECFTKAANQGSAQAQYYLGVMYLLGEGMPKENKKAVKLFAQAANQGYSKAQLMLGLLYEQGNGIPQDYRKAAEWYTKAAKQGGAVAQTNLATLYRTGQGVPQNYAKAVQLYTKAARQGDADAQYDLGMMHLQGHGVIKNYAAAAQLFTKAANQDHVWAQYNLGLMYRKGDGVSQDHAMAVKLFAKAARQGDENAQFRLGTIYLAGDGVAQDYSKAADFFLMAAKQGHTTAQMNLGVMYKNGVGVAQDYSEAIKWCTKAADKGAAMAQYKLGIMYESGHGVSLDLNVAKEWYAKAAAHGHEEAQKRLDVVNKATPKKVEIDFDLEKALSTIIGLENIKEKIRDLEALIEMQDVFDSMELASGANHTLHMIFKGNPGTGKTMFARIVANLLYNIGVLKENKLIETDRAGLVGGYVGSTALKTEAKVMEALDGVLFIDEAYALYSESNNDYGREAMDTLVKLMEDNRERLVVILAGYTGDMDTLIQTNPGLKSRFPYVMDFPDYTLDELMQIVDMEYTRRKRQLSEEARNKVSYILSNALQENAFGNGRYVRNLVEATMTKQARRLHKLHRNTDMKLTSAEYMIIEAEDIGI